MSYNKKMPNLDILARVIIVVAVVIIVVRIVKRENFATACGFKCNSDCGCQINKPCSCKKLPSYCDCKPKNPGPKLGCHGCNKMFQGDFITRESCEQKQMPCGNGLPDMYGCSYNPLDWGIRYTTGPNPVMIN